MNLPGCSGTDIFSGPLNIPLSAKRRKSPAEPDGFIWFCRAG
jgi:hypothetical protein